MSDFERGECGLLASRSLAAHLVRGAIAAGLLLLAFLHQSNPALALGSFVLAVAAMRGCPACWTLGLFETLTNSVRGVARPAPKQRL